MDGFKIKQVKNGALGKKMPATDLWKDQPCLMYLVRRTGSTICQEEAAKLSVFRDVIKMCNIRMVAVVKEFIVSDIETFCPMNELQMSVKFHTFWWSKLLPTKTKRVEQGNDSNKTLAPASDFRVLGGIMLIDTGGTIRYKWAEYNYEDRPSIDVVLEQCKQLAPPEIQEEIDMSNMIKTANTKKLFQCENACKFIRESLIMERKHSQSGNGRVKKIGFFSLLWTLLSKEHGLKKRESAKKGYHGNIKGDVLGGMMLIDKSGGIRYSYKEKEFGDHAPLKDVIEACKEMAPSDVRKTLDVTKMLEEAEKENLFMCENACRFIAKSRSSSSSSPFGS
ncbi:hypothetical protein EDD86DRAFT_262706 [Gorgonomyces haynaldii]|nr:hypothetical protein EDD86DRAFT_262706 [Gorgonomyces haynaldii]